MPAEKLEDMQNVTFTVTGGNNSNAQTVTHGLQDRNGVALAPDLVIVEIVAVTAAAPCSHLSADRIVRSTPANTSVVVTISGSANNAGADWVITARVTCLRLHSMFGADRTT